MYKFKLNLQLFAEDDTGKGGDPKQKSPIDIVLEDNAKMRKELEEMHKKLEDMYEINRSLLSRKEKKPEDTEKKEDNKIDKALQDKFDKFCKGE